MDAVDVFLVAIDSALRLKAEHLREAHPQEAQGAGVKEVASAQTVAEFDWAVSVKTKH